MIRLSLYPIESGQREGKWKFEEDDRGVDVFNGEGVRVSWCPFEEADDRFILPSFWRSIKYIGFKLDDGSIVWFEKDSRKVARVKDFLDEAVVLRGPGAVRALRQRAWLYFLIGLGALILAVAGFAILKGILVSNGNRRITDWPVCLFTASVRRHGAPAISSGQAGSTAG